MTNKDVIKSKDQAKTDTTNAELLKSMNELRSEVKQLRELVNLLVEIIVNMEQDDIPDFDPDVFPMDKYNHRNHFSM